jgi:hypothetical protein
MAGVVISQIGKSKIKKVKHFDYAILRVGLKQNAVVVKDILPFRVKFYNIGIPGYGPNNVPGIGVQVIGYSNYIL